MNLVIMIKQTTFFRNFCPSTTVFRFKLEFYSTRKSRWSRGNSKLILFCLKRFFNAVRNILFNVGAFLGPILANFYNYASISNQYQVATVQTVMHEIKKTFHDTKQTKPNHISKKKNHRMKCATLSLFFETICVENRWAFFLEKQF